jgi:hypothetical protein
MDQKKDDKKFKGVRKEKWEPSVAEPLPCHCSM